jgi:hypothetical protein
VVPLGTRERDVSAVLAKPSGDAGVTPAMTKNVYWITAAQPHRVAIAARPRGGDWLEDDIQRFSTEGIGVLVSMSTPEESAELGLSDEGKFCDQCRISFFNLPIADRSVPNEFEIDTPLRHTGQAVAMRQRSRLSLQSGHRAFVNAGCVGTGAIGMDSRRCVPSDLRGPWMSSPRHS